VDEAGPRRLASPIGPDLGAVTPEETAVSIAAETVRTRRGGTALPLSTPDGPLHRPAGDGGPGGGRRTGRPCRSRPPQ
jgi:xanthine dehydrogenase accessory factor